MTKVRIVSRWMMRKLIRLAGVHRERLARHGRVIRRPEGSHRGVDGAGVPVRVVVRGHRWWAVDPGIVAVPLAELDFRLRHDQRFDRHLRLHQVQVFIKNFVTLVLMLLLLQMVVVVVLLLLQLVAVCRNDVLDRRRRGRRHRWWWWSRLWILLQQLKVFEEDVSNASGSPVEKIVFAEFAHCHSVELKQWINELTDEPILYSTWTPTPDNWKGLMTNCDLFDFGQLFKAFGNN